MTWWIAAITPNLERRASADLTKAGVEHWLPTRIVKVRHRHMKVAEPREYPLFPGYIFARVGDREWQHAWHLVRGADGVRGILANAGLPLSMSDGTVKVLRRRLETPTEAQMLDYVVGQPVRIVDQDSPFCGLAAEVHAVDRKAITVLMDLMGRKTPVEMLADQLAKAA